MATVNNPNVAENSSDEESENFTMLTYILSNDSSALICTSDFKHEAYTASQNSGIILNCGTSSHFTPEWSQLLNYKETKPKPI